MGRALIGRVTIGGQEVTLMKPQTFMNLSGDAVSNLARREKIDPSDILVVYDDMALPLGRIRIRPAGSAGGHNGMRSIIACLHTDEFPRVRVGIGSARREAVDHVLSRFHRAEKQAAHEAIVTAADAIEMVLSDGLEAAMNRYNRKENGNGE
jgi:PTH1 family peptidyl-tRNA hydrolase